jgi:predicted transcriptional regulator with HTH domain
MRISNKKKEKIYEQILAFLFSKYPQAILTSHIAQEIARDEEFTKKLLKELKEKKLVIAIKKNSKGVDYIRRVRWNLSSSSYNIYKKHQIN